MNFARKEVIAVALGVFAIGIFSVWAVVDSKKTDPTVSETADIMLYYGKECPHCKNVDDYLEKNGVAKKVTYITKEVWHNKINNAEMVKQAESCGIKKENLGVPFLSVRGKCFTGEPDVIKAFEQEMSKNSSVSGNESTGASGENVRQ